MNDSNTFAGNTFLLNTEMQFMKKSNILMANAAIKQHQRGILLRIKGQFMMGSKTLAANATFKQFS